MIRKAKGIKTFSNVLTSTKKTTIVRKPFHKICIPDVIQAILASLGSRDNFLGLRGIPQRLQLQVRHWVRPGRPIGSSGLRAY